MPRPSVPLLGRPRELAVLRELAQRATDGRPAFALVTGEGGAGKTRLVETFLEEQEAVGAGLLVGGCPPGSDGSIPYAPVAEALRGLARRLGPGAFDELLGGGRGDIARILPSLGPAAIEAAAPESGQTRLNEALLTLLERLALARTPAILVIEDVQWVDPSTVELLAFLVRNLRDGPVLVVATYRTDELPASHPLRRRLSELERTGRIDRVDLGELDETAQAAIVLACAPGLPPHLVREVVARAGGNPFHAEALALAADAGSTRLPATLREMALDRLAGLSDEARRIVDVASVVGTRVSAGLLEAVIGEAWAAGALRELASAQVLVRLDEPGDDYRFRHGLVREAVLDELHDSERRSIHAALAERLADGVPPGVGSGRAGGATVPAAALARHWIGAGSPERALPWLIRAADDAEGQFAFTEAVTALLAALDIATTTAGAVDSAALLDLRRRAAESAMLADEPARALELAEAVVAGAGGDAPADVTALDLERLARARRATGQDAAALAALGDAVDRLATMPPGAIGLRVRASYARALVQAGRPGEARDVCDAALAAAAQPPPSAGETGVEAEADGAGRAIGAEIARIRGTRAIAVSALGEIDEGIRGLAEARAQLARSWSGASGIRPRPSRIGDILGNVADLAAILGRAGRVDEAQAVAAEGGELARRLGVGNTLGRALDAMTAAWLQQRGRWDEADRLSRALLDGGARGEAAARLCLVRARLELGRGAYADADLHLEAGRIHASLSAVPGVRAELHAVAAELAIGRGHLTDAREEIAAAFLLLDAAAEPGSRAELAWLGVRGEADRVGQARGRRTAAETDEGLEIADALATELRAVAARGGAIEPRERHGFPALATAERTRLDGTGGAGEPEVWAAAAATWDGLGEPYPAAYARWREAEALLERRGPRARAQEAARAAFETARRLDAGPLRRDLGLLAQRARLALEVDVAPVVPIDARTAAIRATGLTARELEVLALIARGRTNRQIADELFITEKTAGHHVSNLLGKLEVASRVEAAGVAHRLGLLEERADA